MRFEIRPDASGHIVLRVWLLRPFAEAVVEPPCNTDDRVAVLEEDGVDMRQEVLVLVVLHGFLKELLLSLRVAGQEAAQ